jgi:DNA-binding NtrC family response regulator
MEVRLPPLRERGEDIVELARVLLEKTCSRLNRGALRFTAEAVETMQRYAWPGNVREMENAIERAVILCDSDTVGSALLAIGHHAAAPMEGAPETPPSDNALEDYFRRFVLDHQERMTETELARRLGISRKSLWERRQRLRIPRPKPPRASTRVRQP